MKNIERLSVAFLCILVGIVFFAGPLGAAGNEYQVNLATLQKYKQPLDDPRPLYTDLSFKKVMPAETYKKLTYDIGAMKKAWAEAIGFRAPDVVGKSRELKPGKYSYKDKEQHPALKELMIPELYKRFDAGRPPLAGNFEEITVVPTRQYYWPLPVAEATKKNEGKTKLDKDGYIIASTYESGYPFPHPSGPFKVQQIMYNREKQYLMGENFYAIQRLVGFNKNLKMDFDGAIDWWNIRLYGRVSIEPLGWYDKRAQENGEQEICVLRYLAPRDMYGSGFSVMSYVDPNHFDSDYVYINVLRRVRKMSSTDSQDAVGGQDVIYEDKYGFSQKLSKIRYPYKFESIAERDYLMPAATIDGSVTVRSKGLTYANLEWELRPMYVIKLTSLDANFVYHYRLLYIDRETFDLQYIENFDHKDRLYRTNLQINSFIPEMGLTSICYSHYDDYIDLHSSFSFIYVLPATWVNRTNTDLGGLISSGK